jgi:hypothetical protein
MSSWLRHCATSLNVVGFIPDEVIGFFSRPHPSSSSMALRSTQPLTEMSARNLSGDKGLLVHKADDLIAICELNVYIMWEPRCLPLFFFLLIVWNPYGFLLWTASYFLLLTNISLSKWSFIPIPICTYNLPWEMLAP